MNGVRRFFFVVRPYLYAQLFMCGQRIVFIKQSATPRIQFCKWYLWPILNFHIFFIPMSNQKQIAYRLVCMNEKKSKKQKKTSRPAIPLNCFDHHHQYNLMFRYYIKPILLVDMLWNVPV